MMKTAYRRTAAWLAALGLLIGLASPSSAQPATSHAANDDFLGVVFVGAAGEGRLGDGAGPEPELVLAQDLAVPLRTGQFSWASGETYAWSLSYEPETFGGAVEFSFEGSVLTIATATPFNSFYVRSQADLPGTSIRVEGLALGPPPSLGGGGPTIFESGMPGTPASSVADADGAGLDVLRISNVDLLDGFTLSGRVTAFFDEADPPQDSELSFQVFAAVSPEVPGGGIDSDGDLVPDEDDNCPNDANPGQGDVDDDEVGDVCDNCPLADNPGQEDDDGDGAGVACDNCAMDCTPSFPDTGTCSNSDQMDSDDDGVGDRCDNCRLVANADQADRDDDGTGDACEANVVRLDILQSPGGPDGAGGGQQVVTEVDVSIECAQLVGGANIGLNLTGSGVRFVQFAGCDPPDDPPSLPDNQQSCMNSLELGPNVDPASSFTLGPGITSGNVPSQMVILRLFGAPVTGGLLCTQQDVDLGQDVFLGQLQLEDYNGGFNPLSEAGFDSLGLSLLTGPPPGSVEIEAELVIFLVNPPGPVEATLEVRTAVGAPEGTFQISVQSDQKIGRLAFGLTSPGSTVANTRFGGCVDPAVGGDPLDTRRCPEVAVAAPIGTNVIRPTRLVAPEAFTYTVGPSATEEPGGAPEPREVETIYIALDSLSSLLATAPGLNGNGGPNLEYLGEVEYDAIMGVPQVTFVGATTLPGYAGGAIQGPGGSIPPDSVALQNTFSPDLDTDNDGLPDENDRCLLLPNGGPGENNDSGGVAFVANPPAVPGDRIGDFCTCGDPGRDGIVDNGFATNGAGLPVQDDVIACQELLSGMTPAAPDAAEFCQVLPGDPGSFNIVDLIVIELETDNLDSGSGDPLAGSLQSCTAADPQ